MPTLVFRTRENCHDVGVASVYGAYVLQSDLDPTQFRVGIAGQRNLGTFFGRLRLHMRSKASPDNWTTRNRPWRPLWTLEMVGGTALATCMVEHLLYSTLAAHHRFTNDSGFTAPSDQADGILDLVIAQTDRIVALVEAQLGVAVEVVHP